MEMKEAKKVEEGRRGGWAEAGSHGEEAGSQGDALAESMSRCQVNEPKCEMELVRVSVRPSVRPFVRCWWNWHGKMWYDGNNFNQSGPIENNSIDKIEMKSNGAAICPIKRIDLLAEQASGHVEWLGVFWYLSYNQWR